MRRCLIFDGDRVMILSSYHLGRQIYSHYYAEGVVDFKRFLI